MSERPPIAARDFKFSLLLLGIWLFSGVVVAGMLPDEPAAQPRKASRQLPPPATVLRDADRASIFRPTATPGARPQGLYFPLTIRAQNSPQPTPLVAENTLKFHGIDFGNQQERASIRIKPTNEAINRGNPISIEFTPGPHCAFGDGYACANAFRPGEGEQAIFLTVHSGVGGEGEPFRRAVEGTWLNQALHPLSQVQTNLNALHGAKVSLSQGDKTQGGLRLAAVVRVPAEGVGEYFRSPVSEALRLAAQFNPALQAYLTPEEPLLIFETCGWKMPGEPWADGVTSTSGSVYLGVIVKEK